MSENDRCPGGVHIVDACDGGLARVRIPGGLLSNRQFTDLAEIAARFGDGFLDITSRANVQLRGIRSQAYAHVSAALEDAMLLPARDHDRIRNIFASPFAGIDTHEIQDMRPFVRELDQALLAAPDLVALPAKTSYALDGGGYPLDVHNADFALQAVVIDQTVRFKLLSGGLYTGYSVAPEHAIVALLTAARTLLAGNNGGSGITRRRYSASQAYRDALARALPQVLYATAASEDVSRENLHEPMGIVPTPDPRLVAIVPRLIFGRLHRDQAVGIARIARMQTAELRLAPWRGLLIAPITTDAVASSIAELERIGVSCNPRDGFSRLATCAGKGACDKALADVRADAQRLGKALRHCSTPASWRANFAGCEKRCAMRHTQGVTFVARPNGYDVVEFGRITATRLSSDAAHAYALALHQRLGGTVAVGHSAS